MTMRDRNIILKIPCAFSTRIRSLPRVLQIPAFYVLQKKKRKNYDIHTVNIKKKNSE